MTMIPDAAAIAAANAYVAGECPTISGRMRAALEAALPHLHTAESYGLWTHDAHPGWVAIPAATPGFVRVHKKELGTFGFYGADINEWIYADVDYHEAAQFARAYFQAHAPKCGEPCPFMDNLYCGFEPGHHEAHRIITGAGMVVTWREAASE